MPLFREFVWPGSDSPEITVEPLTDVYLFNLYDKTGRKISSFVLSQLIINDTTLIIDALSDDKLFAVKLFREYGKKNWPNIFI